MGEGQIEPDISDSGCFACWAFFMFSVICLAWPVVGLMGGEDLPGSYVLLTIWVAGLVLAVVFLIRSRLRQTRATRDDSPPSARAKNRPFQESDNLGTRHNTYKEASEFWTVNMHKDIGPYLVYVFDDGDHARRAMLDLPCFCEAEDSGNLICADVLTFGCYQAPDETWEVEILGKGLSHELWTSARESFRSHGGRLKYDTESLKSEVEPEQTGEHAAPTAEDTEPQAVTFVREQKQISQVNGKEMTYRIHKGPNAAAAKAFLKDLPVTQKLYYIIVETPEGTYGRDIDGIYQQ